MACPVVILEPGPSCLRKSDSKRKKRVKFSKLLVEKEFEPQYFIREDLDLLPTDMLQTPSRPDNSRKFVTMYPLDVTAPSDHRCWCNSSQRKAALELAIASARVKPKTNKHFISIVQDALKREGSGGSNSKAPEQADLSAPSAPCTSPAVPTIEQKTPDVPPPPLPEGTARRPRRADSAGRRLAAHFNESRRCQDSCCSANTVSDEGAEDCNLDYESRPKFDRARYDDEIIKTSRPPISTPAPEDVSSKPKVKTAASTSPHTPDGDVSHTAVPSVGGPPIDAPSPTIRDGSKPSVPAPGGDLSCGAPLSTPSSQSTPANSNARKRKKPKVVKTVSDPPCDCCSAGPAKESKSKGKRKTKVKAVEASPSCPTAETDVSTDAGSDSVVETGCDSTTSAEQSDLEDPARELCQSGDESWIDESPGPAAPSKRAKTRARQDRIKKTQTTINNNVRALAAAMIGKRSKYPCPEIKEWLMDTGSGHDLIDAATAAKFRKWIRQASKTFKLHTAGGVRKVGEELPFWVAHLGDKAAALILPSTPAVLTIGRRCVEEGYHFEWPAFSSSPFMIAPDGKLIRMFVRGYVPYVRKDSFTGEYREVSKDEAKAAAAPSEQPAVRRRKTGKAPPTAVDNLDANSLGVVNQIASNDPHDLAKNHDLFGADKPGGSDADDEGSGSGAVSKTKERRNAL